MSWLKGRSKGTYASLRTQKPMARSEDLVIEKVEDEVLVYDAKNHQAHCLASAAAKVWRACDGTKDVPALAESLALSVDDVTRALEMLDGVELLESQGLQIVTNGNGNGNGNGLTRRQLGLRSAKLGAAAAAAPMLYSVAVPSPAAAATPTNRACALFSTFSCGNGEGAAAIEGCCCCCKTGECKVGAATTTCDAAHVTCPFGGDPGCSGSCNPPNCAAAPGGTCCQVPANGPAVQIRLWMCVFNDREHLWVNRIEPARNLRRQLHPGRGELRPRLLQRFHLHDHVTGTTRGITRVLQVASPDRPAAYRAVTAC